MAIIHANEASFRENVLGVKGTVLVDFWGQLVRSVPYARPGAGGGGRGPS